MNYRVEFFIDGSYQGFVELQAETAEEAKTKAINTIQLKVFKEESEQIENTIL